MQYNNSNDSIWKKVIRFIGFSNKQLSQEDIFEHDLTREEELFVYKALVSGDSGDISKVFSQYYSGKHYFWSMPIDPEHPICKKTTGFAGDVVNLYTNIFAQRYDGIEINNDAADEVFKKISKKNDLDGFILKLVAAAGCVGGGAIKYNPPKRGNLPTLEFVDNQFITKEYDCNELVSITFHYFYSHNHRKFNLREVRSAGKIEYELYENDKPVPLDEIPQTANLSNIYFYYLDEEGNAIANEYGEPKLAEFILATDVQLGQSKKWEHYGESLIEGKIDAYDSLDQVESFNGQTVANAWPRIGFPEDRISKNKEGKSNIFRTLYNSYYKKPVINTENIDTKIDLIQGDLQADGYEKLLTNKRENCVLGKASLNSLGANSQHYNSEDDQREREKTTMYQYNKYKALFEKVLTDIVVKSIIFYNWLNPNEEDIILDEESIYVKLGDFINPSFEARIETVVKGDKVLTTSDKLDILYGNGITSEEKAEKERILNIINYGVETMDELLKQKKMAIQQSQNPEPAVKNEDKKAIQEENK